jgi:hypothetical protein
MVVVTTTMVDRWLLTGRSVSISGSAVRVRVVVVAIHFDDSARVVALHFDFQSI